MSTIEEPTKVAAVVGAYHKKWEQWLWFTCLDPGTDEPWWAGDWTTWKVITDPDTFTNVTIVFPGVDVPPPPLLEPQGLRAMVVGEWDDGGERTLLRLPDPSLPQYPWLCVETGNSWSWEGIVRRFRNLRIEHAGTTA